ncbi:MAG: pyridoxal phosphate biosynthetic protein [Erythrobacter sp.]
MAEDDLPTAQKMWALAAAILFLIAVGFLGFAFNTGVMLSFAVGWLLLQIFGYAGSLKFANGDFTHPLFKTQVILHLIALVLLVVVIRRAFA